MLVLLEEEEKEEVVLPPSFCVAKLKLPPRNVEPLVNWAFAAPCITMNANNDTNNFFIIVGICV